MATAKTIEQLDAAAQINAGDKLPFVQAAGTEAKAGTVAQLAETVADINEQGALSELVYATSQGKNAVAEALTAKGVPTASSETLIQMADKVNNLNVQDSIEQVRGLYVQQDSITTQTITSSYPRIFKNIMTRDTILLMGTKAYFIPEGNYDSWNSFLSGATFTLDVSQEDSSYTFNIENDAFAVSEDFSKLLVTVNSGDLHQIYSISATSGFTKLHEFTKEMVPTVGNYYTGFAVRNDGNYVAYGTASKKLSVYNVTTNTDCIVSYPSNSSRYAYLQNVLMKDNNLYIIGSPSAGPSTSTDYLIGKIAYNITDTDSVTFGTVETNQSLPTSYKLSGYGSNWGTWLHVPGQDSTAPLFYTFTTSMGPTVNAVHGSLYDVGCIQVLSFNNITSPEYAPVNAPFIFRSTNAIDATSDHCMISIWHPNACVIDFSNNIWDITPCLAPYTIKITSQPLSVSIDSGYRYVVSLPWTQYSYGKALYANANTKIIIASSGNIYTSVDGFDNHYVTYSASTDPDKIIFGFIRTINDQKGYYLPYISLSDLQSGAYDVETAITPAVPDGAEDVDGEQEDAADGEGDGQ